MKPGKFTLLPAVLLALLLAACGGDPQAPAEVVPLALDTAAGSLTVYQIDPSQSQARFELDEVLRGEPKTVVGATNQVAGQIALDPADLSTAQAGTITISAAGLETDNNFRNRAIRNFILQTGQYPEITFSPTAIDGLPAAAQPGESVTFTIAGDLTIRDQSRPVTFEVTAGLTGDGRLTGTASTTIQRADFNLQIPDAPGVANVEETVELYIDFVATAA
jgi:polyisoprenoid-binding protein YceI